jgi:hypothetical protein
MSRYSKLALRLVRLVWGGRTLILLADKISLLDVSDAKDSFVEKAAWLAKQIPGT